MYLLLFLKLIDSVFSFSDLLVFISSKKYLNDYYVPDTEDVGLNRIGKNPQVRDGETNRWLNTRAGVKEPLGQMRMHLELGGLETRPRT